MIMIGGGGGVGPLPEGGKGGNTPPEGRYRVFTEVRVMEVSLMPDGSLDAGMVVLRCEFTDEEPEPCKHQPAPVEVPYLMSHNPALTMVPSMSFTVCGRCGEVLE